jgi:hypothetical protein
MRTVLMRSFAFALILGAVLPGLTACAGVRWHKADGDDAALAQDLAACRRQAQNKVGFIGGLGPSTPMDPRFGAPMGPSQADQMMQEAQVVGFCMRDKGYTLVPDNK